MTRYLEIALDLTELRDGSFEVKVRSPAGQASAPFTPPFSLADIGPVLAVGGVRRGAVGSDGDELRATVGGPDQVGVKLFQSLFRGGIGDILARTEGLAASRPDGGVRIRMNFNLLDGGTAAVAALPWELMRKTPSDDPLLVSTQTVLVRSLDVNRVVVPRPIEGPLRVLLIRANPKGTAALDLDREGELIGRSLATLPGVLVDEVDPVESRIFDKLAGAAYHVVHYMGHGDFAATQGGMLLLEDEAGNAVPTSARAFSHLLRDEPLRLVFLNACDTGATPQLDGLHPFAGVAAALVANGVPAVVAMQFPITDRAALTFSRVFYARIAAGDAVDVAVAQGRSALYLEAVRAGGDGAGGEWATPVLYMRAEDGAVLGTGRAATAPAITSAASPQTPSGDASGRSGFWRQQTSLTWMLLGIVVAIIAIVALAFAVDDSAAPPAAEKAATVAEPELDPGLVFEDTLDRTERALRAMENDAFVNDGFATQPDDNRSRTGVDLDDEVAVFKNDRALRGRVLDVLAGDQDKLVAGRAAYIRANQLLFDEKDGITKNADRALELYITAAKAGIPAAMASLVHSYLVGEGTERSLERAQDWLEKARAACNYWTFDDPQLRDVPLPDGCERPSSPDVPGGPGEQPSSGEVVTR